MKSQSEIRPDKTPVERLLGGVPDGASEIARLEFPSIGHPPEDLMAKIASVSPAMEPSSGINTELAAARLELERQEAQFRLQMEEACRNAREEARSEWPEKIEQAVSLERERIAKFCTQFDRERALYFAEVESEVIKLSLAIAARILHREVNLDPLLLTAAARVALEKIRDGSTVTLRVPVDELEIWRESFIGSKETAVQLHGDDRLDEGECVLESEVGSADLGLSAQLKEIEEGFFDLLKKRPA